MIKYNHETNKWEGMTIEYIKDLENTYPDVDVVQHLQYRMPRWIKDNPRKGNKKLWKKFISNWLSREQDRKEELKILKQPFDWDKYMENQINV